MILPTCCLRGERLTGTIAAAAATPPLVAFALTVPAMAGLLGAVPAVLRGAVALRLLPERKSRDGGGEGCPDGRAASASLSESSIVSRSNAGFALVAVLEDAVGE